MGHNPGNDCPQYSGAEGSWHSVLGCYGADKQGGVVIDDGKVGDIDQPVAIHIFWHKAYAELGGFIVNRSKVADVDEAILVYISPEEALVTVGHFRKICAINGTGVSE